MKSPEQKRTCNLRHYRNMPMDAVLALLYDSRDEDYFIASRTRTGKGAR